MSRVWTDEELIRFCQQGPFDDVSPELLDALRHRWFESPTLREAVEASPRKEFLLERLAHVPAAPETDAPRKTVLWGVVAAVCLIIGVAVGQRGQWLNRQAEVDPKAENTGTAENVETPASKTDEPAKDVAKTETQQTPATGTSGEKMTSPAKPDEAAVVATKPETKPAAPVVAPNEIWSAALDLQKAPLSPDETVWQPIASSSTDTLHPDVFRKWFTAYPGRPFNVAEERIDTRSFTNFDGQCRLRAPWVKSSVLRITPYDIDRWAIYLWRGNSGVRLSFYRHRQPQLWGAHRVIRPDGNAAPVVGEFLTNDCARWQLTQNGTFEIRVEDGHLVLARGIVPLLRVPFDGLPDEVAIDGKLKFREFSMYRGEPLPRQLVERFQQHPAPNRFASTKPAELEWKAKQLEGVAVQKTPPTSGGDASAVELTSAAAVKEPAWASTPLPMPGLSEIIFKVDHAEPGTGVYLGRADGTPQDRFCFLWDPTGGRMTAYLSAPWENNLVEKAFDANVAPPPYVGPSQWYRLVAGYHTVTAWVSPDGVSWGFIGDHPMPTAGGRNASLGLFVQPGADRRIRLSHLEVRELPMVASVAAPDVRTQVNLELLEPLDARDLGSWLQAVVRSRPKGVGFEAWRRACAVESLRAVPNPLLGRALLSGLVAEGLFGDFDAVVGQSKPKTDVADGKSLDERLDRDLQLLMEAGMLHNSHEYTAALQFGQLWQAVVEKQLVTSDSQQELAKRPLVTDLAMTAMLVNPLWFSTPIPIVPNDALRRELVSLVQAGRGADVRTLIDHVTFFTTSTHPHHYWWSHIDPLYNIIQWAELSSHRGLDPELQAKRLTLPRRWKATPAPLRHSLAQPLSKEAYNVMAEFQAAISGKAFADACQVIGSAAQGHLLGLLPDGRDDSVLVAFPNAVALAMDDYPELRTTMNEKFGPVGRLRVRQAMENGEVNAIEAATVQFFGTLAAAESERWLGDHAFAGGNLAQARSHYLHALEGFAMNSQVVTAEMTELAGRLQLVAAMLGSSETRELPASITFGDQTLTKDQLQALAADLMKTSGAVQGASQDAQRSYAPRYELVSHKVPPLASYKLEPRGKFEGDVGEHAGNGVSGDVDWFSRQFGITVDGPSAYLSNRFQLMCVDLVTGQPRWNQQLGGEHGHAHHWPMVAMRALTSGNWVFCRRLTKNGPELVCHDKNNGNVIWKVKPKATLVSDPLLVHGRLYVFAAETVTAGPVDLRLLNLHAETGAVLNDYSVVRLFDDPQLQGHPCQATARDGLIYFSVSGVVGCCDGQGQSLWLRKQAWLPPALDSSRGQRAYEAPLLINDLVLATQPGVPLIEGLEQRSGRVRWTRATPDLRRVLGLSDGRLMIETTGGLEALDPTEGQILWRYKAADLLDAALLPTATLPVPPPPGQPVPAPVPQLILVSRFIDGPGNNNYPCIVWIEAATGREVGYQTFEGLADKEPRIGPFIVTEQKTWCFSGKGKGDARRDIMELVPSTDKAVTQSIDQNLWAAWLPEFQRASFPGNAFSRPNISARSIPQPLRDAFTKYASGWLAVPPPNQPKDTAGYRAEVRGQKDVVAVLLTSRQLTDEQKQSLALAPVDALRLVRQVKVPKVDDAVLKLKVGHEAGQKWQLIIEGGSCRVHSGIIDDQTAPNGWQDLQISLAHLAGSTTELTITCAPVGPGQMWAYLANLDGLNVFNSR